MDQFGYDNEFEEPEGLLRWRLREDEEPEVPDDHEPSDFDFYVAL